MGKVQSHNDNDIAKSERRNYDNDIDIVEEISKKSDSSFKEGVLKEISEYRLDRVEEFLFGHNHFMSDCGDFLVPAIKQLERFMYLWLNDLSDESKKCIVTKTTWGKRPYHDFLNSPLWKYESSILKMMSNYTCERCGGKYNPAYLVVHHKSYEHIGSELTHLEDVQVLCKVCHADVHGIRRKDDEE